MSGEQKSAGDAGATGVDAAKPADYYSLYGGKWVKDLEKDPEFEEKENRPWANLMNRAGNGCLGEDFVHHNPKVILRFFWSERRQLLVGSAHFTMDAEGPPGGAHGASIALVFDEILAYPVWVTNVSAFTLNLSINYRNMVPLGSTLRFEAKVVKSDGNKRYLSGKLTSPDGKTVYNDANGLWYVTDKTHFHMSKRSML